MTHAFSLSVAPMMDRTDRHFRYLMRLVSPNARLYTEMITSAALLHGDAERLLAFDPSEHPVAIQLGGSDPEALQRAARLAADAGYDEINLNVGCPSGRVQAGDFGARLMLDPGRVADCVAAMREAVAPRSAAPAGAQQVRLALPVTVKTRIGVDDHDQYEVLAGLTERVVAAGVARLIVHARKAWLSGLSPKENREIPPLDYPRVHRLKRDFPDLPIEINGGFTTEDQVLAQRGLVDGVMLGRAACNDPMLMARLDALLFAAPASGATASGGTVSDTLASDTARDTGVSDTRVSDTRVSDTAGVDTSGVAASVLARYADYMRREHAKGTPVRAMARHLMGLPAGRPGARRWRRVLSELGASSLGIDEALETLTGHAPGTLYNAGLGSRTAAL